MSTKITDHMLKGTSIRTLLQRAAAEAGFNLVDGSFEEGAVVSELNDVVWFRNEGTYYGWDGTIPVGGYIVPAGSTPATSGGIGAGAWVDRTDLTLRSDINIVQKRFACVADMVADTSLTVGQSVEFIGYYSGYLGGTTGPKGGNSGEIVPSGTGTHDGGLFIDLANGLQFKGYFKDKIYTIDRFGGVDSDSTKKAINAVAIGASLKAFGLVHIPIGRYYSDPVASSVVNSVTRPTFIGFGTSQIETSGVASIIDCNNGDFYFNGTASDYSYTAINMVFVGGSSYTSRIFGNDVTTTAEHRCRYINSSFYRCEKGHYSNKHASSSYLQEVLFHSCKYGFYSKSTTSNSKFVKK